MKIDDEKFLIEDYYGKRYSLLHAVSVKFSETVGYPRYVDGPKKGRPKADVPGGCLQILSRIFGTGPLPPQKPQLYRHRLFVCFSNGHIAVFMFDYWDLEKAKATKSEIEFKMNEIAKGLDNE